MAQDTVQGPQRKGQKTVNKNGDNSPITPAIAPMAFRMSLPRWTSRATAMNGKST